MNNPKKYFQFIFRSDEGKDFRNNVVRTFFIIFPLFIFNFFIFSTIADLDNYLIHSALSKILVFNGISPYSQNISLILENYFSTRDIVVQTTAVVYQLPIYHLFLYLPFSFIQDPKLAFSIWETINQLLYAFCILKLANIFGWNLNLRKKVFLIGAGLASYFTFLNIFSANTAILQLFFLIAGIKEHKFGRHIGSGFLLGLSTVDPFNFFLPLAILFLFMLRNEQFGSVIWTSIAIILYSLIGIIFDSTWFLKMIKNIFLDGSFYPLMSYGQAVKFWKPDMILGELVNVIPIIITIWLTLEFARIPKNSFENLFWILSLTICLNPIFIMRNSTYASILFTIPIVFVLFLWEKHSSGYLNKGIYLLLLLISVIYPLIHIYIGGLSWSKLNYFSNNLIVSLFLIFVIYWVRWWVVKPYDVSIDN
jgi:hypothetical protein